MPSVSPQGQDVRVNVWKYISVVSLLILFFEHWDLVHWTRNPSTSTEDARLLSLSEDVPRRLRLGRRFLLDREVAEFHAKEVLDSSPRALGDGVRAFLQESVLKAVFFPAAEESALSGPPDSIDGGGAERNSSASSRGLHDAASHSEHKSEPQNALFFLFNAIVFGTIVLHLTTLPKLHGMQQTVCLFVLGMMYSLIEEGLNLKEDTGVFGESYEMWMGIDPHMLLFAILPALLAGDAMSIDTAVARTVSNQCIFLAGPGVIFGSFMTALFLWVYLQDWDFLLCLVTGSILAATDPVAVVGLLKELGASPVLTVQIQGESLLNDGTAIVLYGVAYDMLKGKDYDASDILIILVLVAICAACLGVVIGWLFFQWIKLASDRLHHHAGMLQTALTICCAYWSFCISEGVLHISGVLCTVFSSLVLADRMWPVIVDKSSLLHIWHMIEYLGNTIIFFLAGALFGNTMVSIEVVDYLHLIVVYIVCTLIRATMLFSARPLLGWLSEDGEPVSFADVCVMTWGGLRGSVGLALAIAVRIDKAEGKIDDYQAKRVLFFVGGIASLTLCINATTCPSLVKMLGVTKTPAARQRMLYKIYSQLFHLMMDDGRTMYAVQAAVQEVLNDAKTHIDGLVPESSQRADRLTQLIRGTHTRKFGRNKQPDAFPCAADVCENLEAARKMYNEVVDKPGVVMELLDVPVLPFADKEAELEKILRENESEETTIKSVNEAFLSLLRSQYWSQLDAGEFVGGSADAEMLLTSTSLAMKHAGCRLNDLKYLLSRLLVSHEDTGAGQETITLLLDEEEERDNQFTPGSSYWSKPSRRNRSTLASTASKANILSRRASAVMVDHTCSGGGGFNSVEVDGNLSHMRVNDALLQIPKTLEEKGQKNLPRSQLLRFIDSLQFNVLMCFILIANSLFILIELTRRDDENYESIAWLLVEIAFTSVFFVEFVIKIMAYKLAYFCDGWNIFDFVILLLSVFGIIVEIAAMRTGFEVHKEARIFRLNRVFRVLRIFRTFRLFKFFLILRAKLIHKDFSLRLAEHLRTITACRAFIDAHTKSQMQLAVFFGVHGKIRSAEEARCILESQTEIYKVIVLAVQEAHDVEEDTIVGMRLLRDNIKVTGKLGEFVHAAQTAGVISAREAETIAHPLQEHVRIFNLQMGRAMRAGEAPTQTLRWHNSIDTFPSVSQSVGAGNEPRPIFLSADWNSPIVSCDEPFSADTPSKASPNSMEQSSLTVSQYQSSSQCQVVNEASKSIGLGGSIVGDEKDDATRWAKLSSSAEMKATGESLSSLVHKNTVANRLLLRTNSQATEWPDGPTRESVSSLALGQDNTVADRLFVCSNSVATGESLTSLPQENTVADRLLETQSRASGESLISLRQENAVADSSLLRRSASENSDKSVEEVTTSLPGVIC